TMIWNEAEDDRRFAELLALTQRALTNPTDLLLWPEAAVPRPIRYDEATYRAVSELARTNRVWIILGSDDAEPRAGERAADAVDYFNSGFLVSPSGEVLERYHKRHLVMFGEYVPGTRWLPFIRWFTPITGSFTPGRTVATFPIELPQAVGAREATAPVNDAPVRLHAAPLICFEDVFPHRVRQHARPDVDFLVNLTNDGWFGESAAQWQHAAAALFRAVENGLPLLRCCNNGLSCWIDANGRVRATLRDARGRVYGPGAMTVEVAVPLRDAASDRTLYNRHGDWFGWSCVAVTALGARARFLRLMRRNSGSRNAAA
ncbi:MAG: apolipoprotein N-acyltransferase, partial [Verrucomicrobiales bacterium]|nr:apolipoprotein N-acyltransferase [Verrucomicrobiales bacterium]